MTSESDFVQPPRFASSLVDLFAPAEQAEALVGDLFEEFIQHARQWGIALARTWYWRQTLKTISRLMLSAFQVAPWTIAVVIGGLFLHRIVHTLPDRALSAITDKYLWYWSNHFTAYICVLNGLKLAHLIGSMFIGCIVAFVAKGREMIATTTLALVLVAMFGVACVLVALSLPIRDAIEWSLWQSFGFFAIIVGGAIVRTARAPAKTQPRPAQPTGN